MKNKPQHEYDPRLWLIPYFKDFYLPFLFQCWGSELGFYHILHDNVKFYEYE